MNGLIDFQCEVYESGYEIIYVEIGEFQDDKFVSTSDLRPAFPDFPDEEFVRFIKPIDPKSTKRIFNLMDYPGAFAELASPYLEWIGGKEDIIDDAFIKFANKYGLLTRPSFDEDTSIWRHHMELMSIAIISLAYIKMGDVDQLDRLFILEDGKFKVIADVINHAGKSDIQIIGQTPPRNSSEAAYHYICNVVNKNLNDSLITEISANPTNTGTDMTVHPKDLISALWLQLAHVVSRNQEFKQCAACSTFFEVKSKKRKNEKIYCSDRCRVRVAARKRRDKEKNK